MKYMEKIREHLYLAALLHDIGKFYQRASNKLSGTNNNLSETSKRLSDYLCPLNQSGSFGYQHSIWTAEFLSKHEEIFRKVLGSTNVYEGDGNSLIRLSAYHHKPDSELSALVSLADWWSAGIDRYNPKDEDKEQADKIEWGTDKYKKIPLYSIFNSINEGKTQMAFPLTLLEITEKCFPKEIKGVEDSENLVDYQRLWKQFEEEFKNLPTDSFNGFAESLLYLLKKYTWSIPSSTVDMADVSLFEHLKTTAAFADCLYLYKEENITDFTFDETTKRIKVNDGVYPVMLFGGDLSGIQKFLYNIASRKAAVSLKGRSFYLQLLIDSVIQRIITDKNVNATVGNVVYSSGGKFCILLPNTKKVKAAIVEIKSEIEQELWQDHFGVLSLNMDFVPFAYCANSKKIKIENSNGKTIGHLWKTLADRLTEQKNQKFKSVIEQNFKEMFEPIKFEKDIKICAVTGIESEKCVKIDEDPDSPYVLPLVKWQAGLGKTLKDVVSILTNIGENDNTYLTNRSKCNNISFRVDTFFFNNRNKEIKTEGNKEYISSADFTRVKKINNTDFLSEKLIGQKMSYGFQFYGGNRQAKNANDEMKTFENLAKVAKVAKDGKLENTYLGILRMDVDNLGSIFIKGLPEKQRSFAAYATLSFLLDWFFSGYLNTIRESDNFKDDVNILYSGGDDLFAVGRWDKLIEFAYKIRTRFEKFVGRSDISISGGIAMVGEKFPIAKAAELAGEAEHKAKTSDNKNALNLFGKNISWKKEFEYVEEWKNKFVEMNRKENMPRSILHKIMAFAELKNKGEMKYAWHTVYWLKRFVDNNKELKPFCDNLQKEVLELNNPRNYDLMAVAARWAELILKEFEKK